MQLADEYNELRNGKINFFNFIKKSVLVEGILHKDQIS